MSEVEQVAYKDLQVWQKSMDLVFQVIRVIGSMEMKPKPNRLIKQLISAVTSVPRCIAEANRRESDKESIHYIYRARGSIYRILKLLKVFYRQGWITLATINELERCAVEIIRLLKNFVQVSQ